MLRRTLFALPCRPSPCSCVKALTPSSSSLSRFYASRRPVILESQLFDPKFNEKHHDLPSFLDYAKYSHLDPTSTVYRGTVYEYVVADALFHKNMRLSRTGGRADRGIDLRGEWQIPLPRPAPPPRPASADVDSPAPRPEEPLPPQAVLRCKAIPVIVQCKANTNMPLGPNIVRELSGTLAYTLSNTIGIIASMFPCTAGARDAIRFSRKPMGYACVSENGLVKQLVWNRIASRQIGSALGVGVRYTDDAEQKTSEGELEQEVVLMFEGEIVDDLLVQDVPVERPLSKRVKKLLKKVKIKKQ